MVKCRSKQKNLSRDRIDFKNVFDSISHEWGLKVLNILKISQVIITFWKYNLGGILTSDYSMKKSSSKLIIWIFTMKSFKETHFFSFLYTPNTFLFRTQTMDIKLQPKTKPPILSGRLKVVCKKWWLYRRSTKHSKNI